MNSRIAEGFGLSGLRVFTLTEFISVVLFLTTLVPTSLAQQTSGNQTYRWLSYQERHSFRGSSYSKDEYTWAYTREFAQRFQMPEQWINAEIGGGLVAVAWRMTQGGQYQACGLAGRANNCLPTLECQIDLYLDSNVIKIEWTKPDIGRDVFLPAIDSMDVLREPGQPDAGRRRYGIDETQKSGNVPVRNIVAWGLPGEFRFGDRLQFGGIVGQLTSYDHVTLPGLTHISYRGNGAGACPSQRVGFEGFFLAYDIADSKLDLQLNQQRLNSSSQIPSVARKVTHKLRIPASFYDRIRPVYESMSIERNAAVNNLIQEIRQ